MEKKRFPLLDSIRGVVLVSMILYHATWNFVYIYGRDWKWFGSKGAYLWQQSICWTFILLSGFCFSLGKRHVKSGVMVFISGALVSLVTILVMPQNKVVFGVLTCIGSCILLVTLGEKLLNKIPAYIGTMFSFALFLLTKNINNGYLGFKEGVYLILPEELYGNYFTTYLGFPFRGFYSTDYFSLFPWLFLFLTGFYVCKIADKKKVWNVDLLQWKIPLVSWLGRRSLLIYLLHQPVIFALQELLF